MTNVRRNKRINKELQNRTTRRRKGSKKVEKYKKKEEVFFGGGGLHLCVLILGAFYIFVVSALYGLIPNALNVHIHISRPLFNKPSFYLY